MNPLELDALLIRLVRAEIELARALVAHNADRTAESLVELDRARLMRTSLTFDLIDLAVERANGARPTDGLPIRVGDRILLTGQTSGLPNGICTVTKAGP